MKKMNDFFTAEYSNGETVHEKELSEIYENLGNRRVKISPTIFVCYSMIGECYFVDYVGDGIGCTLKVTDTYDEARFYAEHYGEMTKEEFTEIVLNK